MNRAQKRQLQAYIHFRDKPASVLALFSFNWRVFALLAVMGLASVGVMLYFCNIFFAWIFGVAYGAVFLRDIGQCIRWSRTWPVTRELLDWSKVERLAAEHGLAA